MFPLSREYLAYLELTIPDGARTANEPTGYRDWTLPRTSPKDEASHLRYLASIRDSAKSGLGCTKNRHLSYFVESIFVNVGGSQQNAKESSPLMSVVRVGGFIVVGARESRVHGEGSQPTEISGAKVVGVRRDEFPVNADEMQRKPRSGFDRQGESRMR